MENQINYMLIKVALSSVAQFSAIERPLKMIKYVVLFHLKSSIRPQHINFFSWLFCDVENCAIREIRLNSKFMTSQSGKQTIATNILPSTVSQDVKAVRKWNLVN